MGVGEDQELGNNISVTVIATGFAEDQQNNLVNSETKKVIYTLDEDQTIEKKLIEEEDNIYDNEVETIKYDSNYNISKDNQIKIDSQINEILRDIEVEYEQVEYEMIDNELINEIEVFDIEEVSSGNIENNQSNEDKITDGLFSDKLDLESVSESVEFVKLDLDEEENIEDEISENENEDESMNNENINLDEDISIEINNENSHAFENPIEVDPLDENRLRRESLKKYNYVFKDGNSSVEDLEKEPAYKRMGIQIKNNINNHEVESKTVLNENNQIEFPEPNTYLHDNVD